MQRDDETEGPEGQDGRGGANGSEAEVGEATELSDLLQAANSDAGGPVYRAWRDWAAAAARVLDDKDQRIQQLELDNAPLVRKVHSEMLRAQKAEAQVAFQKKISCLLGAEITELSDDLC